MTVGAPNTYQEDPNFVPDPLSHGSLPTDGLKGTYEYNLRVMSHLWDDLPWGHSAFGADEPLEPVEASEVPVEPSEGSEGSEEGTTAPGDSETPGRPSAIGGPISAGASETSESPRSEETKAELQEELAEKGLPVSGNKADLIARLEEADADDQAEEDEESESMPEKISKTISETTSKETSETTSETTEVPVEEQEDHPAVVEGAETETPEKAPVPESAAVTGVAEAPTEEAPS